LHSDDKRLVTESGGRKKSSMESEPNMNAKPKLPGNTSRLENGILTEAEVLAIFEPLAEERVRAFGQQFDEVLARLEERFADFVTKNSVRRGLGR
jgi:hypothetical protein